MELFFEPIFEQLFWPIESGLKFTPGMPHFDSSLELVFEPILEPIFEPFFNAIELGPRPSVRPSVLRRARSNA